MGVVQILRSLLLVRHTRPGPRGNGSKRKSNNRMASQPRWWEKLELDDDIFILDWVILALFGLVSS